MELFKSFFRKKAGEVAPVPAGEPAALGHTILPVASLKPTLLRTGKWVYIQDQGVGILTGVANFPEVEVMLIAPSGENLRPVRSHLQQFRIALLQEIPESRRPTASAGAALGYF